MANIIESRVTLEDEVFEETIDTMEEPIEVVRPSSYNDLEDLPQVNGVTLIGNKTSEELGIVTATDIENAVSAEATLRENADTALGGRIDGEKTARENADTALGGRIDGEITNRTNADNALGTRIDNEILARQGGDNNLQTQIDAITSKSDVVDVVADYAALQAYDTQHLGDNDVIKVLDDETHNDAQTYYRWNKTAGTWSYIGSEAPYYSKGQIDQQMQAKQDKLTAGTGIALDGATISADTTVLATKDDLEPEIVADLPAVGDATKLYLTPTNKTASGNPITIDLKEGVGQMTSFQLDGDTYQQSYTGKNLFNKNNYSDQTGYYIGGNGIWRSGGVNDHYFVFDIEPNTTYTFSKNAQASNNRFRVGISSGEPTVGVAFPIWGGGDTATEITLTTASDSKYAYVYYSVTTNVEEAIQSLQIELGSTATTYESFVGGQASPNPDYPQPIQTVTGLQTIRICGLNIYDKSKDLVGYALTGDGVETAYPTWHISDYIPVVGGKTYIVTGMTTPGGTAKTCYYDSAKNLIKAVSQQTSPYTITPPSGSAYVRLSIYNNANQQIFDSNTLQIELGSTAHNYEAYSGTDYPINLGPIELCKLGTYQDYIWKDGDNWKVHKASGEFVFMSKKEAGLSKQSYGFVYNAENNPLTGCAIPMVGVCSHFRAEETTAAWTEYGKAGFNSGGALWFRTTKTAQGDTRTSAVFAQWLVDESVSFKYALATPTDTAITDTNLIAQLEAVRKATLANGQNTITNVATGANLAGSMSIGYYGYNPSEYSEWLYVDGAWEQVSGRPIPTKTSDLDNDSEFVTREEIAPKLQTEVVSELPTVGDEGKLYLTPKNYTTGTATGNPITISLGEDAGQITSAQLDGDTEQKSYTGKNLLSLNNLILGKNNNGEFSIDNTEAARWRTLSTDYAITPIPSGTQLTMSVRETGGTAKGFGYYVRLIASDNSSQDFPVYIPSSSTTGYNTGTITTSFEVVKFRMVLDANTSESKTANLSVQWQLEKGSTATSFEPYVGGVPSPNPDYPQPIQTVTGEQTVTVVGKNLIDPSQAVLGTIDASTGNIVPWSGDTNMAGQEYIPVKPNTAYTLSVNSSWNFLRLSEYTADKANIQRTQAANSTYLTITTTANTHYLRWSANPKSAAITNPTAMVNSGKMQLELGSTATTYAPYSKQTLPISLGSIELCKLGTYQDYIYENDGKWYVHKEVGRIELDQNSGWEKLQYGTNAYYTDNSIINPSRELNYIVGILSPQFTGVSYDNRTVGTNNIIFLDASGVTHGITVRNTSWETLSDFTTWITNNSIVCYAILATPTDTTITDQTLIAQLEAVRNATLQASNTITNTATGTNLAGDLELGYCEYDPTNRYDKWLWLDLNNNYEKLGS